MVRGLDRFRKHFDGYSDHYVLIGGVAVWLVLDEAGLAARATRDLDIVLCIEALNAEFAGHFWEFVKKGGYKVREKSAGERVFYRFSEPEQGDYPEMLELFSRGPDELVPGNDSHLTPIPVAGDVSSLSAILLDDVYYAYLHENVRKHEGVSIIDERCLIPLKAKAWLDMTARKAQGDKVDSKDIRKHRNDALRLYQLLEPNGRIVLPEPMARDLSDFLKEAGPGIDGNVLKGLNIKGVSPEDIVERIRAVFGISGAGGERGENKNSGSQNSI